MKERYITITGFHHYYGQRPFTIGNVIRCRKEPGNHYDSEAIECSLPMIGTVGYVANSPATLAGGTMSAGRIYDHVETHFYVRVMFTTHTKVICKLEAACHKEMERAIREQCRDEDWGDAYWQD